MCGTKFGQRERPPTELAEWLLSRERYDLFRTRFGAASALERDGRTWLDLRQANVELLAALGVRDVTVVTDCTACTPQLASYRVLGGEDYIGMVALMGSF